MKQPLLVTLLFSVSVVITNPVVADSGKYGPLPQSCVGVSETLASLCEIVLGHFKAPQDRYVHLGDEYYFVLASNTGRVAQGVYVVNIATKEIKPFGGYGAPSLVSVTATPDEPLKIIVAFSTMSRGKYAKGTVLYQVRHDPVVDRVYVISQLIDSMDDASEELQGYCSNNKNIDSPACSNKEYWGKRTIYLKRGELDKLFKRGQSLDAYQTRVLIAAHDSALGAHRRKDFKKKLPFQQLEDAGVRAIIGHKPESMSLHRYVNILNDYAFFVYKYGEGRTELAIEILYKVVNLSPDRKVAYLNMYDAFQQSARFPSIPRPSETVRKLNKEAAFYLEKYHTM